MGLKNSRGAPGLAVDLLPINGMKLIVGARLGQRQRAGCHRYSHIWRGRLSAANAAACQHCAALLPNHIRSRWRLELECVSGQSGIDLHLVEGQQ